MGEPSWESRVGDDWATWAATQLAQSIKPYLAPYALLENHDRPRLREIAEELKQHDSEHWAIGELVERALFLLDFHTRSNRAIIVEEEKQK